MNVICFEYKGRFGHFLKAEANASAPSYPVPSRTALLGLIGAILGLHKDTPQVVLKNAYLGVGGSIPGTHWHSTNLRKDPPAPLPYSVKKSDKGSSSNQRNTIIAQEWLVNPEYRVWAHLPEPFHSEFSKRLRERRWHFSPSLGLSELAADVSLIYEKIADPVLSGIHYINSVFRQTAGKLDTESACSRGLAIHILRMPRSVSPERSFRHERYYIERKGRPIPTVTDQAWAIGEDKVVFL